MRIAVMLFLSSIVLVPFIASASETVVSGEELFRSTSLGSNGKSCSVCHPQGKGLEQIGDYDDAILREFVNFCIRDAMKGKMLPEDSEELHALAGYLRSFQKPQ